MTDREYIFCLTYYFYQQNKDKNGHEAEYTNILYSVYSNQNVGFEFPAIYFKRLYSRLKDEALETLENDMNYCQARLEIDKKKKIKSNAN
jgi:hypothetical protein